MYWYQKISLIWYKVKILYLKLTNLPPSAHESDAPNEDKNKSRSFNVGKAKIKSYIMNR